ncbi:hydrogenase expression/formation protein HypE [Microbulbifer sp. SAOS-129_SWC]|uniref:hydrogenase expression/formation protein HypE n=1 Tax=Microbulbifer sp. SAOS-129_SWC TaxID=3145235 RepID=UPI003216C72E
MNDTLSERDTGRLARGQPARGRVDLSHGSGGRAMRELVDAVFLSAFGQPQAAELEDQARIALAELAKVGDRLAFTTDSYVVDPLFFPGGDIGALAVNGTVNDLAVGGAVPLQLSCAVIIEEGFALADLLRIAASMARAAARAGVRIVTGDTKVVPRGAADKLFINTSGIGVIPAGVQVAAAQARPGDRILVNNFIGDHGVAILSARDDLALQVPVKSDTRPLHGLVRALLDACPVHCLRDATRGGLATVLNEFAESAGVAMFLDEVTLPVHDEVRGVSEILGLDPLYYANEGVLVAVVPGEHAERALAAMRAHPAGANAVMIGEVAEAPAGRVVMRSAFGGERIVDMLVGEQLPRIC